MQRCHIYVLKQEACSQHVVIPNILSRQFNPKQPDQAWVTDISYIKTHGGWLYLGAVMDIFNDIEMFYNTKRQHDSNDELSAVEYERQYFNETGNCLVN